MAGDWIKVEVGTCRKTETLRIAEMLGIDRRQCMGLLVDYWSWLDANARTESVPNLSRKSLDDVLQCAGLSACLEAVGWAEWDESGWVMRVVNYDHHNGASAKTRAYEQRKKKLQRENVSRFCPADSGTREEKRRVSTSLRSVDKASEQELPQWLPADTWRDFVAFRKTQKGWTPKAGALLLRDLEKLRSDGQDPVAVIEQSIANGWKGLFAVKGTGPPHKASQRQAAANAMFGTTLGANDERQDPRDISGEAVRVG